MKQSLENRNPVVFLCSNIASETQKRQLLWFCKLFVLVGFIGFPGVLFAQQNAGFNWGNTSYLNMNVGDSIEYNSLIIKVLELDNHFNKISIGNDTVWIKVSRRTLPINVNGVRLFVADNKNVQNIHDDNNLHSLLFKDVMVGVSEPNKRMLESDQYVFPISFNDGFLWSAEEDSYVFSFQNNSIGEDEKCCKSYEGIGIDLQEARGIERHWIVAIENSTVVWIEDKKLDESGKDACVLLQSDSDSSIYYLYNHLYNKSIEVKEGQKLIKGELLGTVWGDDKWGHLQLVVLKSDSIPDYTNRYANSINFFPQFYELYFQHTYSANKSFTRGKIDFGQPSYINRNQKNTCAFEEYSGKGWVLGNWNIADKVDHVEKGEDGNARLQKTLFANSGAKSTNPEDYYDYQVNVKNGVYRVRAKVGDLILPSWQKIDFEGVNAATYSLAAGEQKWTTEKVVKVSDSKLSIRIYIDSKNNKVAGLSEIVFQRAY